MRILLQVFHWYNVDFFQKISKLASKGYKMKFLFFRYDAWTKNEN